MENVSSLQLQFPCLGDEVVTEFVVRFFVNQLITCLFVDMTGGIQHTISPEHDLPVACLSGEALTFTDKAFSDAKPARLRIDQQQSQLCHRLRLFDEKNRADIIAIPFRNPAAFPFRIKVLDEPGGDLGDQRLELLVPAVLLGIQHSVLMDDPAHIAWLGRSNEIRSLALRLCAEQPLDDLHRCNQTVLICGRDLAEKQGDLIDRTCIERSEFFLTLLSQGEMALPAISSRRRSVDQSPFFKAAENTT